MKGLMTSALVAALAVTSGVAAARDEVKVQIASSSSGGSLYALGSAWSKEINSSSDWLSATPVATGGGTENLRLLGSGEVDFGTVLGPESTQAYNLRGKYEGMEPFTKLRAIWAYTYGGWQYVVLEGSDIHSFEDMKDKRVSVGAPGSSGAVYVTELLEAHGLKAGDDYTRETLSGSSGTAALGDGNLDVFAFGGPIPVSYVSDLATSKPIRLVPVDEAVAEKYVEANPGFFMEDFRNDGYPNQANAEPVPGVWWKQYWATRDDVDEDVVYEATKALFDNIEDFRQAHSSARVVGIETALDEVKIPLHPGAIRYYREQGVEIPENLIPPEAR